MINIVHDEAGLLQKSNEPLATLASYRRMKVIHYSYQKVMFILLSLILTNANKIKTSADAGKDFFRDTAQIRKKRTSREGW